MLERFRSIGSASPQPAQQEGVGALHLLITRATEERAALNAVLDVLALRSAQIVPLARQLDEANSKAATLAERLNEMSARFAALDGRTSDLEALNLRIEGLTEATARVEQRVRDAVGPGSELHRHRVTLEQVSAEVRQLNAVSQTTEQGLRSLSTLSEQVTQKTKALEHQQQIVEHALVQSNRVAEMVWAVDNQLTTVTEGLKRVGTAQETIERIERLAADTAAQLTA